MTRYILEGLKEAFSVLISNIYCYFSRVGI